MGKNVVITTQARDKIVFFEISSEAYYKKFLQNPVWPELASGITIGVGFDLGYCTVAQFMKAWGGLLPESDLKELSAVCGLKGKAAEAKLASVKHITVPLEPAKQVFTIYSLPDAAKELVLYAPTATDLFPDCQGGLLSLVYNRGRSTVDKPGQNRRKEMKAIQALIPLKDYAGIAAQIKSMKRLWAPTSGLIVRRDTEAALVAGSNRQYSQAELINL